MDPTPGQIALAREVGLKLSRNLPRTGVLGPEDVVQMAIEALLVLLSRDGAPDPSHLRIALQSRTIDAMRKQGTLRRLKDDPQGRRYHEPERATFDSLEPFEREVLTASFDEDLTPKMIAERSGRKVGWVYVAKSLALRSLRGNLTERQLEVICLSADGLSGAQAAKVMGISEETVKSHRKYAVRTLGARNMPHAIAIAFRRGMIT